MAQLSLEAPPWRMIRRALKVKPFRFADVRDMARKDQARFDWLVANGFFVDVGDGLFELTDKGHSAADLGYYEWEPEPKAVVPDVKPAGKKGKK